jgi:hypothetical protein
MNVVDAVLYGLLTLFGLATVRFRRRISYWLRLDFSAHDEKPGENQKTFELAIQYLGFIIAGFGLIWFLGAFYQAE